MGWLKDVGLNLATGGGYGMNKLLLKGGDYVAKQAGVDVLGDPGADAEKERKRLLYEQAAQAGDFANQGQAGYNNMTGQMRATNAHLRDQMMGRNSLSAEQLRQGLGQQMASQQAMAASANPGNAAMSARNAMNNMSRAGYGMSGQAAMAGIQERNAAANTLGQMNLAQRGQDMNVALGSRGNAMQGYGAGNAGAPEKSWIEKYGPMIQSGAQMGAMASDERLKTDIKGADDKVTRAMERLKAYSYKYKNDKYGKGEQVGIMAQDLKKAGLDHAVIETDEGLMVHGAKLAGANTAMIAAMNKRLSKLESK